MQEPNNYTTTNNRLAKKWCTKKEALQEVVGIPGYRKCDVRRIEIMGFIMWGICDEHMRWLTSEGYERWNNGSEK